MNNKGQTLIFFILVLPILLIILSLVVDTGLVLKEYTRFSSTTKTIIKNVGQEEEKIKELYEKNNIPIENLTMEKAGNKIKITNEYEIESIFGKIIGIKSYKIKKTIEE